MSLKYKANNPNWEKEELVYDQENDTFYSYGVDLERIIRNYNYAKYMIEFEIEENQKNADKWDGFEGVGDRYKGRLNAFQRSLDLLNRE